MKHINMDELNEELEFVEKAKNRFNEDPKLDTFGDLEADSLFAIRWGFGEDCLLVFRITDEPRIYGNILNYIKK